MKKAKSISIYVSGFATALALVFAAQSTFAASVMQQIYVNFDPIKIIIDGQEKAPPDDMKPMVYNGRTYVALRYVGEALGKEVAWEESTRTIRIGAPAAKAMGHSETFTDGTLSSKWEKAGGVLTTFDGPNGMLVSANRNLSTLALTGVLPDAKADYTIEFDAALSSGYGTLFYVFLGMDSNGMFTDGIKAGTNGLFNDKEKFSVYDEKKAEEYYSVKLKIKDSQADIYIGNEYISSQKLGGNRAAFAFAGSYGNYGHYYIKNFKLTVD